MFFHLCEIKSEINNIDTWEISNIWKQINTFLITYDSEKKLKRTSGSILNLINV